MVLLTAPSACSGADQFAAMFIDNELGLSVGMPEGGCSNTGAPRCHGARAVDVRTDHALASR